MPWLIDPPSFGLHGGTPPTTADEFAEQQWPPCPVCGTTVDVDRIDISAFDDVEPRYIMGQWECPNGCDPKRRTVEELWSWTGLGEPFRFNRATAPQRTVIALDN